MRTTLSEKAMKELENQALTAFEVESGDLVSGFACFLRLVATAH
jgi:hypothetical protein